jgi:hypothetical protein
VAVLVIAVLLIAIGAVSAYVWRASWKLLDAPLSATTSLALPKERQVEILASDLASLKAVVDQLNGEKDKLALSVGWLQKSLTEARETIARSRTEIHRLSARVETLAKSVDRGAKPNGAGAPPAGLNRSDPSDLATTSNDCLVRYGSSTRLPVFLGNVGDIKQPGGKSGTDQCGGSELWTELSCVGVEQ